MKDMSPTKLIVSSILAGLLLTVVSFYTCAQERIAKTDSSERVSATVWTVYASEDSCTGYMFTYDSHCWKCKADKLPKYWSVIFASRTQFFIKPKTK